MPRKPTPRLNADQQSAHEAACRRGLGGYMDPESGLFVMSESGLRARGTCCGSACRHCPYDWKSVPEARLRTTQADRERRTS